MQLQSFNETMLTCTASWQIGTVAVTKEDELHVLPLLMAKEEGTYTGGLEDHNLKSVHISPRQIRACSVEALQAPAFKHISSRL